METFREYLFERTDKQAEEIRKKLEGGLYYGIPISEYPNQENVHLVIAYHLHFLEMMSEPISS